MTVPLREFRGNVIYLDTMLPYALLRGIDEEVKRFFERIEGGEIQAYTADASSMHRRGGSSRGMWC